MNKGSGRNVLVEELLKFKKEFFWVGVFSLFANVLMLTPTVYMIQVFDRVLTSYNELTLLVLTVIMVFFFGVMAFADWLRSRLLVRTGVRLDEQLNSPVFMASFESYLRNERKKGSDAFSSLMTVRQFLTGNGVIAFFDVPWTPVYIAVTFLLHPFLGWLSILFCSIQLLLTWTGNRAAVKGIEEEALAVREGNSFLQSKLRNIEPVHAMGMQAAMRERWLEHYENALEKNTVLQERQHRQQAFSKFVRYCMQSFTLGAGALLVIDGKLSPGAMIAANVLMSRALQPLDLVIASWRQFVQARMAFYQLQALFEECPPRKKGIEHPEPDGTLVLEGVSAFVDGRESPILQDVSFSVPAGSVVVVVGPSGAGKSTLVRCLVGVWTNIKGRVLLDNQLIDSWDRGKLGPHIGYLPQDVELFEGSIAENIARFSVVDPEKVIDAAKRTGIHEMILHFSRGYDTPVGEAGGVLSGGQRQRLGIARAIYDNPALVVLDEPNSNLDDAGERSLAQSVRDMKEKGKTVLIVTHRTSILAVADLMLVLEQGRVKHFGQRDSVIASLRSQHVAAPVS